MEFERIELPRKAQPVPIAALSEYNFYTLCSESLIRGFEVQEVGEEEFEAMLVRGEAIMQGLLGNA